MKVLAQNLSWEEALKVLASGGAVNRPHFTWGAGGWPWAVVKRAGDGVLIAVNDAGNKIHDFVDAVETLTADVWQSVELAIHPKPEVTS